jgi:cytochrome c553
MATIPPNQGSERRFCAAIASARVWLPALAALAFATASWAEDTRKGAVPEKEVQAKLQYCKVCHGVSAQGFRGYYPIPRLAGQQPTYLENQLQAFIEHRRTNNVMFNVSHSLSPSMVTALAANFNALNPPPLGGAPRQLVVTGGKIFQDGLPDPRHRGMRRLPRSRCRRRRLNSSFGRSALSVRRRQIGQLGQRARPKSKNPGHIGHHESGCAQPQQIGDRSGCGLCQHSEIIFVCLMADLATYRQ